jgi:hypothetical protein
VAKNAIPGAEGLFCGIPIHRISHIQPENRIKWRKNGKGDLKYAKETVFDLLVIHKDLLCGK